MDTHHKSLAGLEPVSWAIAQAREDAAIARLAGRALATGIVDDAGSGEPSPTIPGPALRAPAQLTVDAGRGEPAPGVIEVNGRRLPLTRFELDLLGDALGRAAARSIVVGASLTRKSGCAVSTTKVRGTCLSIAAWMRGRIYYDFATGLAWRLARGATPAGVALYAPPAERTKEAG